MKGRSSQVTVSLEGSLVGGHSRGRSGQQRRGLGAADVRTAERCPCSGSPPWQRPAAHWSVTARALETTGDPSSVAPVPAAVADPTVCGKARLGLPWGEGCVFGWWDNFSL